MAVKALATRRSERGIGVSPRLVSGTKALLGGAGDCQWKDKTTGEKMIVIDIDRRRGEMAEDTMIVVDTVETTTAIGHKATSTGDQIVTIKYVEMMVPTVTEGLKFGRAAVAKGCLRGTEAMTFLAKKDT